MQQSIVHKRIYYEQRTVYHLWKNKNKNKTLYLYYKAFFHPYGLWSQENELFNPEQLSQELPI